MFDIIAIGSALVDIYVHSDNFETQNDGLGKMSFHISGDKVEVESFKIYSGGGGSNVAVGFSRLGFRAAIICETGRDDFSHIVINDLRREKVSTNLIIEEKREQTGGSVILVGENGGRTAMAHRGASSQLDTYDISTFSLSKTRWIHLSGIAGQRETLKKIFDFVGKNPEIGLSWNPGKTELALLAEKKLKIVDIPCQIFVLNKQEWKAVEPVQKEILHNFSQIIVTDGSRGGRVYLDGKEDSVFPSREIKSVDDTGAGDAFTTGYVAARLVHKPPQEAVKWGIKNATSVIKYYGAKAGLLWRRDIEKK